MNGVGVAVSQTRSGWLVGALAVATVGVLAAVVPAAYGTAGSDDLVTVSSEPAPSYVPLTPTRILDTRDHAGGPIGSPAEPIGAGESRTVTVTGVGGVPEDGVGAVVVNVTAVNATDPTFVTVYPEGDERPDASTFNPRASGPPIANEVIAKVGDDGQVQVYNHNGEVDILFDVVGWLPTGESPEPLEVVTTELDPFTVGLTSGGQVEAAGGRGPYTWDLTGLPAGVQADETGMVWGTPTAVGSTQVQVEVEDVDGQQASAVLHIVAVDGGVPEECQGQGCALLDPGSHTIELDPDQVIDVERDETAQTAKITMTGVAPQPDQVLVAPQEPDTLESTIVRVEQITDLDDGMLQVEGPLVGLGEAYDSGVIHLRDQNGTTSSDPGMDTQNEDGLTDLGAPSAVTCESSSDMTVEVDLITELDPSVYVTWSPTGVDRVDIHATLDLGLTLEASLSGELACSLDLPGLTVWVPSGVAGVAGVFRLSPVVELEVDASVVGQVEAVVHCATWFGYQRGVPAALFCGDRGSSAGVDVEQSGAKIELTAGFAAEVTISDLVGLTGTLTATADSRFDPGSSPQATLDMSANGTLAGCVGCFLGDNAVTATLLDHTWGPTLLWTGDLRDPDQDPDGSEIVITHPDGWEEPLRNFPGALWTYANEGPRTGGNHMTMVLEGGHAVVGPLRVWSVSKYFQMDVIAPDGGVGFRVPYPLPDGAWNPYVAAAAPGGDLLALGRDSEGATLVRFAPDGEIRWQKPLEWPHWGSPNHLAVGPNGRVYLGDPDGNYQIVDLESGGWIQGPETSNSDLRFEDATLLVSDEGMMSATGGAAMEVAAHRFDGDHSVSIDLPADRSGRVWSAVDADGTTYVVTKTESGGCRLVLDRVDIDWSELKLELHEDLWSASMNRDECGSARVWPDWVKADPGGGVVVGWSLPYHETFNVTRIAPDGTVRSNTVLEGRVETQSRGSSQAAMAADGTLYVLYAVEREETPSDECGTLTGPNCRDARVVAISPNGSIETVLDDSMAPYSWVSQGIALAKDRIYVTGQLRSPRQQTVAVLEHPGVASHDPRRSGFG